MESFYFLIPIALVFVAIALRFLFWAIHSGQYDNLDTEAHRILFDEERKEKTDAAEPSSPPAEAAQAAPETVQSDKRKSESRSAPSQESSHD